MCVPTTRARLGRPRPATPRTPVLRVVLALVTAALLLGWPTSAEAHSDLLGTTPQDGSTVSMRTDRLVLVFGEPVDAEQAQVVVTDPRGRDVVAGRPTVSDATVEVPLKLSRAGAHRATYRIVSADGHPVVGKLGFEVRRARPTALVSPGTGAESAATAATRAAPETLARASTFQDSPALALGVVGTMAVVVLGLAAVADRQRRQRRRHRGDDTSR